MNDTHTEPADPLDSILIELVHAGRNDFPNRDAAVDKAKANVLACLPHKDQCICDKSDEGCLTCMRVAVHNQTIDEMRRTLTERMEGDS